MDIELNNIYNCDCIDGLKSMQSNSVDLIITSPPYNVGIDYDVYDDNKPYNEYLKWCELWMSECYRVLKDDGRICINHCFCTHPTNSGGLSYFPLFDLKHLMENIGYQIQSVATWDDATLPKLTAWGSWMSASSPFISVPYEGILIAYKKYWKKQHKGVSTISKEEFIEGCSGIWHIGTTSGYTKACFPEKLPHICINLLSYEDDVILDPFSGSGTTCYVAKGLKRNYIGFELSSDYYIQSISRLNGTPYKVINNKGKNENNKTILWD